MGEIDRFDLSTAYLRRAHGDVRAFMSGLAARLEASLPDTVEVVRKSDGLFSKTSHVVRISVRTRDAVMALEANEGRMRATREKVVRDVVIGTKEVTVPEWLDQLGHAVGTEGDASASALDVLRAFLVD